MNSKNSSSFPPHVFYLQGKFCSTQPLKPTANSWPVLINLLKKRRERKHSTQISKNLSQSQSCFHNNRTKKAERPQEHPRSKKLTVEKLRIEGTNLFCLSIQNCPAYTIFRRLWVVWFVWFFLNKELAKKIFRQQQRHKAHRSVRPHSLRSRVLC